MIRKRLPVEKELWSQKSKDGLDYVFASEFYEDKPFSCRTCDTRSVFTAEQQKYTYEVKKAYTWEQHVLCAACFALRNELMAENKAMSDAWAAQKPLLKKNRAFLLRWKEVVEMLPNYGIRKDYAQIRMLTKLLLSSREHR